MEASPTPKKAKEKQAFVDSNRLHWSEYLGMAGALVLAGSLFLPWFGTSDSNPNSLVGGKKGDFNAFEIYNSLPYWLLAACIAPFLLTWIVARAHKLTWRPGEITMIVGITAFALIIINGIIFGKPGDTVDMEFRIGYLVGLLGTTMIAASGLFRQAEGGRVRKAPGTL